MNKTKAFSKAAVIIAMIGPISGCDILRMHHIGWHQNDTEPSKKLSEDAGSTDANNTKTQPTSGPASTDPKSKSDATVTKTETSTIETTGNGVTPTIQFINDNNLGMPNSIPTPIPWSD